MSVRSSRIYNDFFKFLGGKPHKLCSKPLVRIKVAEEMYNTLMGSKIKSYEGNN